MRAAALLAVLAVAGPSAAQAQSPEPTASLSADTVRIAEAFELRVEVPVPTGSFVFFPDTLPSTPDIESYGPVEWRASRGPDGGATLTLRYRLIPFGTGPISPPPVDVVVVPEEDVGEAVRGDRIPGGSRVGDWVDAPRAFRYTRGIQGPAVRVAAVFTPEEEVAGLSPRPPADVVGLGWSWPSILLVLVFSSVIGGAVVTSTREWLANRPANAEPAPRPTTKEEARRLAIAELDRLLAEAPHAPEAARELYTTSSGAVRTYVQHVAPDWGPELTSTELVARLDASGRATPELNAEMVRAEAVKFGGVRPDAPTSERHLRALRGWLAGWGA